MKTLTFFAFILLVSPHINALNLPAKLLLKSLKLKSDTVVFQDKKTRTREIILSHSLGGDFRLLKKDPICCLDTELTTLFILSGLETGSNTVELLPSTNKYSIVSLDYIDNNKNTNESRVAEVLTHLPEVQWQIVLSYLWLAQQAEVNPERIVSLNISFGTFMTPQALRILGEMDFHPLGTAFLFGGASIEAFLPSLIKDLPKALDPHKVENILKDLLPALEPSQHLPKLHGPFLVLNALYDEIIPPQSAKALADGLSQPKAIVEIPTKHIGNDRKDVIRQTLVIVMAWLSQL